MGLQTPRGSQVRIQDSLVWTWLRTEVFRGRRHQRREHPWFPQGVLPQDGLFSMLGKWLDPGWVVYGEKYSSASAITSWCLFPDMFRTACSYLPCVLSGLNLKLIRGFLCQMRLDELLCHFCHLPLFPCLYTGRNNLFVSFCYCSS